MILYTRLWEEIETIQDFEYISSYNNKKYKAYKASNWEIWFYDFIDCKYSYCHYSSKDELIKFLTSQLDLMDFRYNYWRDKCFDLERSGERSEAAK